MVFIRGDVALVEKWIPPGEEQRIETLDLDPGTVKCQNAFYGAVTTFTYNRITPVGEKIEEIFESYYRPLQRICLVGVEELTPTCEGEGCKTEDSLNSGETEDLPVETEELE